MYLTVIFKESWRCMFAMNRTAFEYQRHTTLCFSTSGSGSVCSLLHGQEKDIWRNILSSDGEHLGCLATLTRSMFREGTFSQFSLAALADYISKWWWHHPLVCSAASETCRRYKAEGLTKEEDNPPVAAQGRVLQSRSTGATASHVSDARLFQHTTNHHQPITKLQKSVKNPLIQKFNIPKARAKVQSNIFSSFLQASPPGYFL